MSASWPGNMRGPRMKTPLLLLLLLLLTTLTRTVFCQDDDTAEPEAEIEEQPETETQEEDLGAEPGGDADVETPDDTEGISVPDPSPTEYASAEPGSDVTGEYGSGGTLPTGTEDPNLIDPTGEPGEDPGLSLIIILIPVVLVVVIIGMIVCGIFINRRLNKKVRNPDLSKEDPYLDGSSTEKVPMPMFEEDVPSVLELEMEELDQWMKKDSELAEDSQHA